MRIIVFLFSIFFLSLSLSLPSFAQEEATPSAVVSSASAEISYTLPYPGILPDNPLYTFKVIRDRIILFLINDSLKRADYYLLQADKRLQAGVYLYNQNPEEVELVISTISKGENYFELALVELKKAQEEGRDTVPLLEKMGQAAAKHEQVINDLADRTEEPFTEQLQILAQRAQTLVKRVNLLNLNK